MLKPQSAVAVYVRLLVLSCVLTAASACSGPPPSGNDNSNTNDNTNANGNVNDNTNANDNGDNTNDNEVAPGADLTDFRTDNFSGSGSCAACHNDLTDSSGTDVSIADHWRATMMANAARDPFFLASVYAEVEKVPSDLRGVVEDSCASCHMPMARTQAVALGDAVGMLDDGFLDPDHPLHEAAMDGVSCTLCHQIQNQGLGQSETFNGQFRIDTAATEPDRPIYGPFDEVVDPELMQVSVGYLPQFGEHVTDSRLCATCHTLYTPTLDAAGNIVGQFPEQTPYLEWLSSVFANPAAGDPVQHCQDCHMPTAEGAAALSVVPSDLEPRSPFYQHRFQGGNVFMLRLLRDHVAELGLTASSAQLDDMVRINESLLSEATAELTIQSAQRQDQSLSIVLRVDNLAGHKFPTGFPSRRAWLHLTVSDADGAVLFESGAAREGGRIARCDADHDAATFEPHYDVITIADEVQIYEAIMANTADAVTYTLLRADRYAKDNRLLPAGYDPATASPDTAPAGAALTDADFTGGSDAIEYRVAVGESAGPFTIDAELLFQSVSFRFIEEHREETASLPSDFVRMADDTDHAPTVVDVDQAIVP